MAPPFKSHLNIIDVLINILNPLTHDVNAKLHAIVKLHPPATEAMLNLAQRPSPGDHRVPPQARRSPAQRGVSRQSPALGRLGRKPGPCRRGESAVNTLREMLTAGLRGAGVRRSVFARHAPSRGTGGVCSLFEHARFGSAANSYIMSMISWKRALGERSADH